MQKGFPEGTTIEQIQALFEVEGKINAIRIRKDKKAKKSKVKH